VVNPPDGPLCRTGHAGDAHRSASQGAGRVYHPACRGLTRPTHGQRVAASSAVSGFLAVQGRGPASLACCAASGCASFRFVCRHLQSVAGSQTGGCPMGRGDGGWLADLPLDHVAVCDRGLSGFSPGGDNRCDAGIAKALSRLLLLLTGLLLAQEGEIRFGAAQVNKKFIPELRRHVGIVFENPDNQLFMPTVFEDLPCGPLNMCMSPEDLRAVTLRALKTVGASHLADRPPWQLSSGGTRAVAIAGVPAMHPDILILDEPSNALDPGARRRLIRLLQTIEHTKIIATHDLDLVLDGCSRVIVLNQGRILADAPPLQIFSDETLLATASLEKPLSLQRRDCSGASRGFNQRRDWGGQVV